MKDDKMAAPDDHMIAWAAWLSCHLCYHGSGMSCDVEDPGENLQLLNNMNLCFYVLSYLVGGISK